MSRMKTDGRPCSMERDSRSPSTSCRARRWRPSPSSRARFSSARARISTGLAGTDARTRPPSQRPRQACCHYVEFQLYRVQVRYITFPTTLVLQAIADGVRYGFDIADRTGLQTGTVYPALRRLESLGFVRSNWESEKIARREQRPARRYYEITRAGADALAVARKRFENLARLSPGPRHA